MHDKRIEFKAMKKKAGKNIAKAKVLCSRYRVNICQIEEVCIPFAAAPEIEIIAKCGERYALIEITYDALQLDGIEHIILEHLIFTMANGNEVNR